MVVKLGRFGKYGEVGKVGNREDDWGGSTVGSVALLLSATLPRAAHPGGCPGPPCARKKRMEPKRTRPHAKGKEKEASTHHPLRLRGPAELCELGLLALQGSSAECRNPWIRILLKLLVAGTQQGSWFRGKAALKAFWFGIGEALAF